MNSLGDKILSKGLKQEIRDSMLAMLESGEIEFNYKGKQYFDIDDSQLFEYKGTFKIKDSF